LSREQYRRIEIYTLGQFKVKRGDEIITEQTKAPKVWALFQYLLTQRGAAIPVDTLVEDLWPEQEFDDPRAVVKSLVYRLRNTLGQDDDPRTHYITSAQGAYSFNPRSDYWLDSQEFEALCEQASQRAEKDPEEAIRLYDEALELYKGEFLEGNLYSPWTLVPRNRYKRLYLEKTLELLKLLKEKAQWGEIRRVCERYFAIDPFEEDIHLHLMESLLAEGQVNNARAHYQYVSSLFFHQHGTSPSPALRELYRKMNTDHQSLIMDVSDIQEEIRARDEAEGAFFCNPESFRQFYKLEERRLERTGQTVFLNCLTITTRNHKLPTQQELEADMRQLGVSLRQCLRRGDIVCRWNEAQYLVLLSSVDFKQDQKVLERVKNDFLSKARDLQVALRCQCRPLKSIDED